MAIKITKRIADAEQPDTKDRIVFDSEVKGFGLKITPAGKKTYILQYRMGGRGTKTQRYTIGAHGVELTAEEARNEAIKLRGKIRSGVDPQEEKKAKALPTPRRHTFAETADAYLRHAGKSLRPTTLKEWTRILDRDAKPRWRDRFADSITRRDVRELLDEIAGRGAEIQANRTLARLRTMFGWAAAQDFVTTSPIAAMKLVKKETERDRVLSDDEVRWFWRSCESIGWPFGPLFQLLLLTAQRRDEVGTMEWSEIDFDKKLWTIPRNKAKNDRAHEVHLSEPAIDLLRSLPRIGGGYVFTTNERSPVSGYSRAKERLDAEMKRQRRKALNLPGDNDADGKPTEEQELAEEIPAWILHDLRRTAATGMAKLNVPPHVVDKILNHVSGTIRGVAAIYNRHTYSEERRAALGAWAGYLNTLSEPYRSNVIPLRAQ